ncbi:MAG: hypothetical protein COT21_01245 [Hadesarchaea archaeon CG08_land_8_20_14_0_20_51_8]|nr:MAG: hypothetical protein COT21_01245 [Hadesarchaea archaeon CG08_land_8_20_14_0_20_51_8]
MYRRLCDDEIEELRKLSRGSELILADTCALCHPDAVSNAIGNSKGLVICDFVEHELHSLDGKYSKKFLKEAKQSRERLLIFLRTQFKTKRESMGSLNTLPADVKHLVIKVYRQSKGLEKESRHRDFALISEAFLLTQAGVNCGILSLDRCIEKTLYELSNFGYGIEFYRALGFSAGGRAENVAEPQRIRMRQWTHDSPHLQERTLQISAQQGETTSA